MNLAPILQGWQPPPAPPEEIAFRSTIMAVTIIVYTIVVLGIGYWAYRKTRTVEDWMVAGRRQSGWLVGLSWGATYFSAVILIGFGGQTAVVGGLAWSWIASWNCLFGGLLSAILAYWIWRFAKNTGASTVPEMLAKRYPGRAGKAQQVLLSILIWVFLIFYVVATNKAAGSVLQVLAGWPYWVGVTLAAVVAFIYIVIGGLLADLVTDAIQAVVLMVGTVALMASCYAYFGGVEQAYGALKDLAAEIASVNPKAPLVVTSNQFPPMFHPLWWTTLSLCILTSFNIFWPHLPQRFLAYKGKSDIGMGILVATVFTFLVPFAVYLGYAPLAMPIIVKRAIAEWGAPNAVAVYNYFNNPAGFDLVIPTLIDTVWPIWASAIYLAAIFCAIMSTTDGIMHLAGAVIGNDVVRAWVKPTISERGVFKVVWIATIIFGVLGWVFAIYPPAPVLENFAFAVSVPSAALAGPLLGIFWKRITKYGALTGMVVGAGFVIADNVYGYVTSGAWFRFGTWIPPFEWIHPFAVGVFLSLIVTIIVSLATPKEPREHLEKCFAPI